MELPMTVAEYYNLKPGDRVMCEVEGRERIMRVTHWQNRMLCGNLHKLDRPGWCRGTFKLKSHQVCEQTYSAQGQQLTISDMLIGGAA